MPQLINQGTIPTVKIKQCLNQTWNNHSISRRISDHELDTFANLRRELLWAFVSGNRGWENTAAMIPVCEKGFDTEMRFSLNIEPSSAGVKRTRAIRGYLK